MELKINQIKSQKQMKKVLNNFINNSANVQTVESNWKKLSDGYVEHYSTYPGRRMERREISFHDQVKLLAYLLLFMKGKIQGDILEIGVWKGKSLALIESFSESGKTYGLDYCLFENQFEEISFFQKKFFPQAKVIAKSAEMATAEVFQTSEALKLLHIDGGHERDNVWADFLIYSNLVKPGGFIVFDDYVDPLSPHVGPAVDELNARGFFRNYEVIGQLEAFPSSFVLRKLPLIKKLFRFVINNLGHVNSQLNKTLAKL